MPINLHTNDDEANHFNRLEKYAKQVDKIYQDALKEFQKIAEGLKIDPEKPFSFSQFPQTSRKIKKLVDQIVGKTTATIRNGMFTEWDEAEKRNDKLTETVFQKITSKKGKTYTRYLQRNNEAKKAFVDRKEKGLGLSDRVWNLTGQFKTEVELALDLGIGKGKSAVALARDVRAYLNNSDKLLKEVKNKHGAARVVQVAEIANPGQGVYKSATKNAMRLTRTETNMAYRTSDYERWQQMEFVTGFEIKLSNRNNHCPVCAELAGKYPKEFKFVGWHPQCMCYMVPILADAGMLAEFDKAIDEDRDLSTVNVNGKITDLPANFKGWLSKNEDRINRAKSTPFFIKDNKKMIASISKPSPEPLNKAVNNKSFETVIDRAKKAGVEYRDVKEHSNRLTESEIIQRISGGDMTKGSCSSLALVYAGNKGGLDVLDFRGGESLVLFSRTSNIEALCEKAGGVISKNTNDFVKANDLLKHVEEGKEYYFSLGKHAAIVRRNGGKLEYLELQSRDSNGYKDLNIGVLKTRFGAKKSHNIGKVKVETKDVIIDIDLLNDTTDFKELLGYINTAADKQKKGLTGTIK